MTIDLQLVGVGKVYDNGTPAVIDFDLEVSKGEFIAFLGPSGCGKTTTLRMIAGFETISSGNIFIRGNRINDVPPERGIKEGDLRDGGSLEQRASTVAYWHQWPDEYDYLMKKWDEFLSA